MLLELRPAPSPSAIAYVEFCRCHLADVVADPGDLASTLTPDVVDLFTGLLDRWQRIAEAGPVFA